MSLPRPDRFLLSMCAFVSSVSFAAPGAPVGAFSHHGDVGHPAIAGATSYDPQRQAYHLSASGANMWGGRDEFQFAWWQMEGDFILRAWRSSDPGWTRIASSAGWCAQTSPRAPPTRMRVSTGTINVPSWAPDGRRLAFVSNGALP